MMHDNEIINFALHCQILTCTQNLHHNQFQEAEDTSTISCISVIMAKNRIFCMYCCSRNILFICNNGNIIEY